MIAGVRTVKLTHESTKSDVVFSAKDDKLALQFVPTHVIPLAKFTFMN